MDDAKELWSWWQSLLAVFREEFTLGGWARFAQWVTGTVLCQEEHTITQILTALGMESAWRNVEHFAEYGAWDREAVEPPVQGRDSRPRLAAPCSASDASFAAVASAAIEHIAVGTSGVTRTSTRSGAKARATPAGGLLRARGQRRRGRSGAPGTRRAAEGP